MIEEPRRWWQVAASLRGVRQVGNAMRVGPIDSIDRLADAAPERVAAEMDAAKRGQHEH